MSYRLHPTKNKKLRPGEPKHYQFEYYSPDPDHPGKRIRHTVVQQFKNDKQAQLYDYELKRAWKPPEIAFTLKPLGFLCFRTIRE
ncbi:MAG: hypothetical protein HXX11_23700 [Desulfuromonadales bacterium]|nr:hypothetical protein [Desulfuromonadales bacterium]